MQRLFAESKYNLNVINLILKFEQERESGWLLLFIQDLYIYMSDWKVFLINSLVAGGYFCSLYFIRERNETCKKNGARKKLGAHCASKNIT